MFFTSGAGKKKWLTDPIEILPFPNQNLRDKVPTAAKPMAPPVRQAPTVTEPTPKIATVPTGQLNTGNISIKKLMEKKEDDTSSFDRLPENLPHQPFTFDQVKMLWRRYAFEMKEKGMETFYNAMIKREPIQKEATHYVMDVDNQIQVDYINPHLQEMVAYFRKELKNHSFEISFTLNDNPETEDVYLTGNDKFKALARKNPNLHTLKNTFNLDIEF